MTCVDETYKKLVDYLKETALLDSCLQLLGWDEQTYMPPGGAEHRAKQCGLLAGLVHQRMTAPQLGEWLAELEQSGALGEPDSPRAVNVRETRRLYDRATKLPRPLVEEISRTTSQAQHVWVEARRRSDFGHFRPWLDKVVRLKREEAQALEPPSGELYDALLDEYEPGATRVSVASVLEPLRDELVRLVRAIGESGRRPCVEILRRRYPVDAQQRFGRAVVEAIGFDFHRGRIDVSPHPFCCGIGPGDCRLTTRYDEHFFPSAFFGMLHEAGHGLYDQGLDPEHFGTPMGESVSLGVHESQSRMWENFVGRSRAFWEHFYGVARQVFPEALGDVSLETFYAAVNDVRPTLIRVEADEVTYNLHILVRFELEPPLLSGDLAPEDVPAAWNQKYAEYLGVTPSNDAEGCLQDIHWSAGLIGYFPTYALGNMYAAQFFQAAGRALGDLPRQFAAGQFAPLRQWLRDNIHRRGKQYPSQRLVEVVTGQKVSHGPLVEHLTRKFGELYGL